VRDHRLKHQSKQSEIKYVPLSDRWDIVAYNTYAATDDAADLDLNVDLSEGI
jgi:hypothetical protein